MVIDEAGCYHVLSCLLLCATLTYRSRSHTPLCIVERNSTTPVPRRLSLTHTGLKKNILGGTELTSATHGVGKCLFATLCSICNFPIVLHWCLTGRDCSAVSLLLAQMESRFELPLILERWGTNFSWSRCSSFWAQRARQSMAFWRRSSAV